MGMEALRPRRRQVDIRLEWSAELKLQRRAQPCQRRVPPVQMIEDDGAAGLVKAEQLIDFDAIVAIHIVRGLDFVGGIDDGHFVARRLSGRENTIDVVEGQKLFEIVWPVPPDQEPLRLEISAEEVFLADRIDYGFKRPRFHIRPLAQALTPPCTLDHFGCRAVCAGRAL